MRKFLLLIATLVAMTATAEKENAARRLVTLLTEMSAREEVTPDSFFADVRLLRHEIAAQSDSAACAVYRATLAHLLAANQWRAQARRRDTQSHADSVQEWTREEYRNHARLLYSLATRKPEVLHAAPTKQWIPLVRTGRDEAVFGNSMLSVVYNAMKADGMAPSAGPLAAFYEAQGLREAALRVMLDSIRSLPHGTKRQRNALETTRQRFEGEPAVALVYLRMAQSLPSTGEDSMQQRKDSLLTEALRRYPSAPCRAELENELRTVRQPHLEWEMAWRYTPGETASMRVRTRNVSEITWRVYRLPNDFENEENDEVGNIKRQGTLLKTARENPNSSPLFFRNDTLHWTVPTEYGRYAVVAEGKTKAKVGKTTPAVAYFCVTRLNFFAQQLPNATRLVVVDNETGEPQQGVTVDVYHWRNGKQTLLAKRTTGKQGRVDLMLADNASHLSVRLSRGDDMARPEFNLWNGGYQGAAQRDSVLTLRIFTDRSIYRPGQTVHMAALAYKQKDWDARTTQKTYSITYFDANNQTLAKHEATTDAFGMLQDSLRLPDNVLPGSFRIRVGSQFASVSVEEYRRPTFNVELTEIEALRLKTGNDASQTTAAAPDSVTVTGRAETFSGVPLSNARVTGDFTIEQSRWGWWIRDDESQYGTVDTVYTDADGQFRLRLPLKCTAEQLRSGRSLRVSVDVLSPQGETQQAERSFALCTTPLRLTTDIPSKQDKENGRPWEMQLWNHADRNVTGEVLCELAKAPSRDRAALEGLTREKAQIEARFTLQTGKRTVPDLQSLPSGVYKVFCTAVVNGDTARSEEIFTLFSMHEARLAEESDLRVYCPCDTFDLRRAAEVRIGTSLPEAWLHILMTSEAGVAIDTVMHVRDTAFVWQIPYRTEYKQGCRLTAAVYKRGLTVGQVTLHLRQPDMALRPHWDTFRNRLRPGQHEEWRLSLRRADGTPADANVLLSLYDASLDALAPHALQLYVSRPHRIPYLNIKEAYGQNFGSNHPAYYALQLLKVRNFEFSAFDEKYFGPYASVEESDGITTRRMYKTAGTRVFNTMAAAAPEMAAGTQKFAAQGQIAGLSMDDAKAEETEAEADNGNAEAISVANLRSNMNELAFFEPQLRTDAQGLTCIAFTLPESLTSWHLTGFAHTRDMAVANIDEKIIAQKELMAELHLPRFLRQGDKGTFSASIRNISTSQQRGKATWQVVEAETERVVKSGTVDFDLQPQTDTTYFFPISGETMLSVRWIAKTTDCSDGEARPLAALTNTQNITETRAFSLSRAGEKQIDLRKLFQRDSQKAQRRTLTVEYTARPIWLAVQSLPSLMQPTRRDILSLSASYYAGALAAHIAQNVPDMKAAVKEMAADAKSNGTLAANQELADLLLQETPWVMDAEREKARHERLKTLFESETQESRRMTMLTAMRALQQPDGSFAWFPGMRGSSYLTCEVAYLLTRLYVMTGQPSDEPAQVADGIRARAVEFLRQEVAKEVERLRKEKKKELGISTLGLQYLYLSMRSGEKLYGDTRRDADFMLDILRRQADSMQGEERAMAAIVLQLAGEKKQARSLMQKFHTLLAHPDGTYLAYPSGSFTSIDRKIQRHVQLMEAVSLVEPEDTTLMQGMQEWFLQQKRTQEWERPMQTADAVYALLLRPEGGTYIAEAGKDDARFSSPLRDVLQLQDGRKTATLQSPETSLGYLRQRVEDVKSPRTLSVKKQTDGLSWGAVYAQYQMPASEVEAQTEGLRIERTVENQKTAVGDRVHVRYVVTADRDYEYVRLAAPRPAAAEPESQHSGYRWHDGLGYYVAQHDASTEYFIDRLPRGTYVIEEDWLIAHAGAYTLAPALLQCLYAPEFQAHTAGGKITVEP